jgi:hypothetical protein
LGTSPPRFDADQKKGLRSSFSLFWPFLAGFAVPQLGILLLVWLLTWALQRAF